MTLEGEREIEYKFIRDKLPRGSGAVLDLGPGPRGKGTTMLAIERGWRVVAIGLEHLQRTHSSLVSICGDFVALDIAGRFDWTLCVSTIEHFGLAGRYGVDVDRPDHDLAAMRKLRSMTDKMLLTMPVGVDTVFKPWHRVYGKKRLPKLFEGWRVIEQHFRAKVSSNVYEAVSMDVALAQEPTVKPFYYALGLFVLEAM